MRFVFFQAEDGIRDLVRSRGLGDVYKRQLVYRLKSENGKNIFCDGGAEIVNELLKDDLIDEIIISVIPILVGNGTKLFKDGRPVLKLELVSTKQFDKGLTQLHYKRADK